MRESTWPVPVMKPIGALASHVLYNAHLNKNVHAFCENREYWQKAHTSGLALSSSGTGARS
jgi:hypothetical protein